MFSWCSFKQIWDVVFLLLNRLPISGQSSQPWFFGVFRGFKIGTLARSGLMSNVLLIEKSINYLALQIKSLVSV